MSMDPFNNGRYGDDDRDHLGSFRSGNRAAAGRQPAFARQRKRLQKALYTAITPADMRAIAVKLVEAAKGGNLTAIKLVLLWLIGTPPEAQPRAPETPPPEDMAF
jgi:hypothetical protein